MADDQKPKTMDINDLVRELSKSATSPATPTPPLAPAPQASRPSFSTPPSTSSGPSVKPPTSPPMAGSPIVPPVSKPVMPQPKFNVPPPQPFSQPSQPKPVSPPVSGSVTPPSTPNVKEYQSSIRTMGEDISKIKQGQKPTGIDIPRKVEQVIPAPQVIPPKPAMPSQQFKIPSVNLGETKKTGPLAQSKQERPIAPSPIPVMPKAAPGPQIVEPKQQIYVPEAGQKGGNRNMLFIGIGAVAIVAGFSYWFFVLRSPAPEVVIETSTPTPTATPIQNLDDIFSNLAIQSVGVVDPVADLNSTLSSTATEPINVNGGEFIKLNITSQAKGQTLLGLFDFLMNPKQELVDSFAQDKAVLLYGQEEIFDSKGQIKVGAPVEKRLVFVYEVKDAITASNLLREWESEMANDLKAIFQFDPKKQANPGFLDNLYQGTSVRYKNFPYADKSVDYAIVSVSNEKNYLVIGNSRESVYAVIDKLRGF